MTAAEARLLDAVKAHGSPLYVYDEATLRDRCRSLKELGFGTPVDFLYALKANSNRRLLGIIREEGFGIDAVSEGEVRAALRAGFEPRRVSYTGNNSSDAELRAVHGLGVHVTVDSISALERFGRAFPDSSIGLRINPNFGDGHHAHVVTGGEDSKFGVAESEVQDALAAAARHRLKIDVVQQHIGSGILDSSMLTSAMGSLLEVAAGFPHLRVVDFGGGFGIPYRPGEEPLDLAFIAAAGTKMLSSWCKKTRYEGAFRFEPGRFVVAACGTLCTTVTTVKRTSKHTFVGTDSGFHHLLRPMVYDAYHRIENLSNPKGATEHVTVVGNICESGDVFARDRAITKCREGDLLAIRDAGAYGFSMASTYNLRPRPAEVLLPKEGAPELIRARESIDSLLQD